jgi:hypothetical protein
MDLIQILKQELITLGEEMVLQGIWEVVVVEGHPMRQV